MTSWWSEKKKFLEEKGRCTPNMLQKICMHLQNLLLFLITRVLHSFSRLFFLLLRMKVSHVRNFYVWKVRVYQLHGLFSTQSQALKIYESREFIHQQETWSDGISRLIYLEAKPLILAIFNCLLIDCINNDRHQLVVIVLWLTSWASTTLLHPRLVTTIKDIMSLVISRLFVCDLDLFVIQTMTEQQEESISHESC